VTDDPWRKPDPSAPVTAPAYAPVTSSYPTAPDYYGTPPVPGQYAYAPPAALAYNPYQAPLPKRGGYKRLLWILGSVGVLVLGGCGVGIFFAAKSVTKNIGATNAFLRDVRDQQFAAAYGRLCPSEQAAGTAAQFAAGLQAAVADGHGVTSYDITSANTTENFGDGGGTSRTASGTVTFANGQTEHLTFALYESGGRLCVLSGVQPLF
jgi:hypothetical protein